MELGLRGRVALVSGSYRGTGAGIAAVLAAEGAAVAVHGFESGQPDEVVRSIEAAGGRAAGFVSGLDGEDLAQRLVSRVAETLGPVEVLVNNYGTPGRSSWEPRSEGWQEAWESNVLSGVRLAQQVVPHMRERRWGRIVFVGTAGTARPGARNPGYYGAKAALAVVVRSLARELAGTGVTVNLVSPGLITTDEVREMIARRAEEQVSADTWEAAQAWAIEHLAPNLTGRLPDPQDVGRVVAFVASQPAWHLDGVEIRLDGGARDA